MFGISVGDNQVVHLLLADIFANIKGFQWQPFVLGMICIFILLFMSLCWCKFRGKTYTLKLIPAALLVLVFGTLFAFLLKVGTGYQISPTATKISIYGIRIVGTIPPGLPSPRLPGIQLTGALFGELLLASLPIAMIGFLEAVSMAKMAARKFKYEISPNQELVAIGFAQVIGGIFSAYPCTGSFSRSAVMIQTGGKTQLAGLIVSAMILLTLLFLTPLFYYVPYSLLAAIIIVCRLFSFTSIVCCDPLDQCT